MLGYTFLHLDTRITNYSYKVLNFIVRINRKLLLFSCFRCFILQKKKRNREIEKQQHNAKIEQGDRAKESRINMKMLKFQNTDSKIHVFYCVSKQ